MKKLVGLFLVLLLSAQMLPGLAYNHVNKRQVKQGSRIQQGVVSGSLTRHEAKTLKRQETALRHEEKIYRSDGHLSAWERHDLKQDQNKLSRHIYVQKHDGQSHP